MIHIERTPAPAYMLSEQIQNEKKQVIDFYSNPNNAQTRYGFHSKMYLRAKNDLLKMTHGKCAYCESNITGSVGDIEHHRPKSIYWWLAYEWDNILIICQICNRRFKTNQFPIENTISLSELEKKTIEELNKLEAPLLLDPCIDFPEEHLKYVIDDILKQVNIEHLTNRGQYTIDVLGLNRVELSYARYLAYNTFITLLKVRKDIRITSPTKNEIYHALGTMISENQAYVGMLHQIVIDYYKSTKDKELEILTDRIRKERIELKNINKFIPCEIEIQNFKTIDNLHFIFRNMQENKASQLDSEDYWESWLLILGENGVGKSSVLQAVILALLPKHLRKKYLDISPNILQLGKQKGFVKIKIGEGETIEMNFDDKENVEGNLGEYNDYLIAYGSTRLLPKGNLQPENNNSKIKIHNFFDYSFALENAEQWLLEITENEFNQAARFIKDLLFLSQDLTRNDNKIYTHEYLQPIELGFLSDGYKTLIALAIDMYKTFYTKRSNLNDYDVKFYASGIVLIDEIGTHLHPRWKMEIVKRLRQALPNVFFIVTTHEPLCLRGTRDKEVIVLKRNIETSQVEVIQDLPSHEGLRIDQILTSKFFGLNSTIDIATEQAFEKYYKLLGKAEQERSEDDKIEIEKCQAELKARKQLGDNLREEFFYYVIDELIAKNVKQEGGMKTKNELKNEVKLKIAELMNKIDLNSLDNDSRTEN